MNRTGRQQCRAEMEVNHNTDWRQPENVRESAQMEVNGARRKESAEIEFNAPLNVAMEIREILKRGENSHICH